jgi:mRNA interferase MazF
VSHRSRTIRRGEVYWTDFSTARGGEIGKTRPAIVVSNNTANRVLNRIQVVPLTTNTRRVLPGETIVHLNGVPNKAMADQITTVTKERVGDYVGAIDDADMRRVDRTLIVQLGLPRR